MKRIILTGVSDGLGSLVAKKLLDQGVKVVGISRSVPKDERVIHLQADLTSEGDIENVVKIIKEKYSAFDAMVHVAGIFAQEEIGNMSFSVIKKVMDTNINGMMFLNSQLFDLIKQNEADILATSSTVGYKAYKDQTAYTASKWAVRGYIEALRLELSDTKCRVTNFAPGGFQSAFVQKFTGDKNSNLSAYMDPEGLADTIVFILNTPKEMEISDIVINRKKK